MLFAVCLSLCGLAGTAMATTPSSSHYQITETQFSAGSLQSCSVQYCAQASIGDTASTPVAGAAVFGSTANTEPVLEMIVEAGASNLGILKTETTATKTTTVHIRSYLSNGYVLQVVGDPPKFNGHTLDTPTTPTLAETGIEQFGINAAANTIPSVGADAVQVPADQAVFGTVSPDYSTPNFFKYISGDVIAHNLTASGQTNYTISMIVNISSATPAGHYSGDFAAIVIPLY